MPFHTHVSFQLAAVEAAEQQLSNGPGRRSSRRRCVVRGCEPGTPHARRRSTATCRPDTRRSCRRRTARRRGVGIVGQRGARSGCGAWRSTVFGSTDCRPRPTCRLLSGPQAAEEKDLGPGVESYAMFVARGHSGALTRLEGDGHGIAVGEAPADGVGVGEATGLAMGDGVGALEWVSSPAVGC